MFSTSSFLVFLSLMTFSTDRNERKSVWFKSDEYGEGMLKKIKSYPCYFTWCCFSEGPLTFSPWKITSFFFCLPKQDKYDVMIRFNDHISRYKCLFGPAVPNLRHLLSFIWDKTKTNVDGVLILFLALVSHFAITTSFFLLCWYADPIFFYYF